MTIEIHKPELEALIRERMKSGAFQDVEDVLIQALKPSPTAAQEDAGSGRTGAELVAAMRASPYREIDLEAGRDRMPVRDVAF
ncbi:MAG: hypothetical protein WA655_07335 [Candidatus Korobacteraceae bacterium]